MSPPGDAARWHDPLMTESVVNESSITNSGVSLKAASDFAKAAATPSQRRHLQLLGFVLTAVGLLDIVGVLALGAASAWLLASSAGQETPALPLAIPGLDPADPGFDLYRSALILLGFGVVALLLRTLLSIVGTRRLVRLAFTINENYANRLWRLLLRTPRAMSQITNSNNVAYALNYGATGATATVVIAYVLLISDIFLVAALAVTVLILSPIAGVTAGLVFGVAAVLFVKVLSPKTHKASAAVGNNNVDVDTITRDGIHSYKEAAAAGTLPWVQSRLEDVRHRQLTNQGRLNFYLLLPRYAAEIVLIVSLAAVGAGIMIAAQGPEAAALLVAYAAAASRIMPAVIRIQSSIVQIRMGSGQALLTYTLVKSLEPSSDATPIEPEGVGPAPDDADIKDAVRVRDVSFSYEGADWGLRDVDLTLKRGEMLALVGPSGSGKTTLANIVLGLLAPDAGSVEVLGGRSTPELFEAGRIAYVPQDACILHTTVRDNVVMGRDLSDELVLKTLESVGLADIIQQLPSGLDTRLDEQGGNLSGGQRQRLGLARALVASPELLILDEATSALDARSEKAMGRVIADLKGTCAVLVIAHRLRTVAEADEVVYLDRGVIAARGTFDELRERLPDFAELAQLAGVAR